MALNKPATQSSNAYSTTASLAVDGNTDGDFDNGSVTHTWENWRSWWEVDLQNVEDITTINVYNRTDCCSDRLQRFYVFVSDVPLLQRI